MLIIFGSSEKKTQVDEIIVFCPVCNRETCHSIEDRVSRLTLYFVPVLPYRKQKIQRCNVCGKEQPSGPDQARINPR